MCRYYNAAGRAAFGEAFYQMSRRKIFFLCSLNCQKAVKKAGMVIMPVFVCREKILILVPLHNEWEV